MFVINDPKTGKSYKKEGDCQIYMSKKIGDKVEGNGIGMKGYELEITGGSDSEGFPMRKDVSSYGRKKPLVVSGVGAKAKDKGIKQRKTVHGNLVDETINQLNLKVIKFGRDEIEKALGLVVEEEAKPTEKVSEEEVKEEVKEVPAKEEKRKTEEKPVEEKKEEIPEKKVEAPQDEKN
ncbi:30S ribosomal protein S6e [archaeon]|nr:30S ribosomal protein S6e [archaeon]